MQVVQRGLGHKMAHVSNVLQTRTGNLDQLQVFRFIIPFYIVANNSKHNLMLVWTTRIHVIHACAIQPPLEMDTLTMTTSHVRQELHYAQPLKHSKVFAANVLLVNSPTNLVKRPVRRTMTEHRECIGTRVRNLLMAHTTTQNIVEKCPNEQRQDSSDRAKAVDIVCTI